VDHQKAKNKRRVRRAFRVRKRLQGTPQRPRLSVRRSLKHIYCQVIDDSSGNTLASASTAEKDFEGKSGGNCDAAKTVGELIAERVKAAGVAAVCLDRGPCKYHGRVAALTDAVREAGIKV